MIQWLETEIFKFSGSVSFSPDMSRYWWLVSSNSYGICWGRAIRASPTLALNLSHRSVLSKRTSLGQKLPPTLPPNLCPPPRQPISPQTGPKFEEHLWPKQTRTASSLVPLARLVVTTWPSAPTPTTPSSSRAPPPVRHACTARRFRARKVRRSTLASPSRSRSICGLFRRVLRPRRASPSSASPPCPERVSVLSKLLRRVSDLGGHNCDLGKI
jgi:hypothetical protein